MKRKTFIAILAIAMVLVLSLAVLTACNNKKHDFSSKWEYDEKALGCGGQSGSYFR